MSSKNPDLVTINSKTNIAITRSGSSMLAELTNVQIPFVSVPLPTSKDNHQLKNAFYYQRKDLSFLVEEKDLNKKLYSLICKILKIACHGESRTVDALFPNHTP